MDDREKLITFIKMTLDKIREFCKENFKSDWDDINCDRQIDDSGSYKKSFHEIKREEQRLEREKNKKMP